MYISVSILLDVYINNNCTPLDGTIGYGNTYIYLIEPTIYESIEY